MDPKRLVDAEAGLERELLQAACREVAPYNARANVLDVVDAVLASAGSSAAGGAASPLADSPLADSSLSDSFPDSSLPDSSLPGSHGGPARVAPAQVVCARGARSQVVSRVAVGANDAPASSGPALRASGAAFAPSRVAELWTQIESQLTASNFVAIAAAVLVGAGLIAASKEHANLLRAEAQTPRAEAQTPRAEAQTSGATPASPRQKSPPALLSTAASAASTPSAAPPSLPLRASVISQAHEADPVVTPPPQIASSACAVPLPAATSETEPTSPEAVMDDWLGAQFQLIADARRHLRAGNPAEAVKILNEYWQRYPEGTLGPQVIALHRSATRAHRAARQPDPPDTLDFGL